MPLPLVVLANRQTQGRGRGTNWWWSDEGSLTFTLALDPSAHGLTAMHEPRLALAAAVAVVDATRPYVPPQATLGIRWPNDIEAGNRKLGGILPERVETAGGVRILIGVGLNVRTRLEDAPPEVRRMAATLAEWVDDPDLDSRRSPRRLARSLRCDRSPSSPTTTPRSPGAGPSWIHCSAVPSACGRSIA